MAPACFASSMPSPVLLGLLNVCQPTAPGAYSSFAQSWPSKPPEASMTAFALMVYSVLPWRAFTPAALPPSMSTSMARVSIMISTPFFSASAMRLSTMPLPLVVDSMERSDTLSPGFLSKSQPSSTSQSMAAPPFSATRRQMSMFASPSDWSKKNCATSSGVP